MKKTKELNRLFEQWKASNKEYKNNFAEDGIIEEARWENSKRKILFLLKETNELTSDLRNYIKANGPKGSNLLHNVGRWAYGLQRTNKLYFPYCLEADNLENKLNALLSSAIINLKKSAGEGSADMEEIKTCALRDKEFIRKEIGIIDPELIICGYTFYLDVFEEIFSEFNKNPLDPDRFLYKLKNYLIIDFWHPAGRSSKHMLYYTLCSAFQKYCQSKESVKP